MNKNKKITRLIIFLAAFTLIIYFSLNQFKVEVPKEGGKITEALLEKPRFINPVISLSNADKSLSYLIYSPLLELNGDGIATDNSLVESYEISEDKKEYTVTLKNNVYFHDGVPLTTKDIEFTIKKIQDPLTKSFLIGRWFGIETEITDDRNIKFTIQSANYNFIDNLKLRILPKHIWGSVSEEEFAFSNYNIRPVGSGSFKIKNVIRNENGVIERIQLSPNDNYYNKKPYLDEIEFVFFDSITAALDAYKKGEINSIGGISLSDLINIGIDEKRVSKIKTSRIFSIYFNEQNEDSIIKDAVKKLVISTLSEKSYLDNILSNSHIKEDNVIPSVFGFNDFEKTEFTKLEEIIEKLEKDDWILNENGIFTKNGKVLEIELTTPDSFDLVQISNQIKLKLEENGVKTNLKVFSPSSLQEQVLRDRDFEILLFGMQLDAIPSVYPFWHSFSTDYPGINISSYSSINTDSAIEKLQVEFDSEERIKLYKEILVDIDKEKPVLPLYSPFYLHTYSKNLIKPNEKKFLTSPEERFYGVEKWHTKSEKILNIFR